MTFWKSDQVMRPFFAPSMTPPVEGPRMFSTSACVIPFLSRSKVALVIFVCGGGGCLSLSVLDLSAFDLSALDLSALDLSAFDLSLSVVALAVGASSDEFK